jgi:serine/threonine-protein kinase
VTETVVPLPGIPDELWQLMVQCLAKAPASRLRASELGSRLRELLPMLAGMPPLDVDEPDVDPAEETGEEPAAGGSAPGGQQQAVRRRGAVPLVPGAKPTDANRDTHTSMRVPAPDELAGGALGTARAPRAAGSPRPGSARNRAVTRRRRIALGAGAAALVAAIGLGTWLATSGDDADATPRDTENSAPVSP